MGEASRIAGMIERDWPEWRVAARPRPAGGTSWTAQHRDDRDTVVRERSRAC
jgi:hypothetical protein